MTRMTIVGAALLLCTACDGGPAAPSGSASGPGSGSGGSNTGTMSARVDGDQWTASSVIVNNQTGAAPALTITGDGVVSGDPLTRRTRISIVVTNPVLGVFQLAQAGTLTGSLTLEVSDIGGTSIWIASPVTPSSAGTVIITSLTSTRAVGAFTATVVPSQGAAANDVRSVTSGAFDVSF